MYEAHGRPGVSALTGRIEGAAAVAALYGLESAAHQPSSGSASVLPETIDAIWINAMSSWSMSSSAMPVMVMSPVMMRTRSSSVISSGSGSSFSDIALISKSVSLVILSAVGETQPMSAGQEHEFMSGSSVVAGHTLTHELKLGFGSQPQVWILLFARRETATTGVP